MTEENPKKRARTRKSTINAGPTLDCLMGYYDFDAATVPYLTAHLSVTQAAEHLQTPDELPGWVDKDTELEALFQRQLDHSRVENKILPYLMGEEKQGPRFFNSITIALIPYDRARSQIIDFDDGDFTAPELERASTENHVDVGPLKVGFFFPFDRDDPTSYATGEMRWNTDQVACVAIDGQHRLAALKRYADADPEQAQRTQVCVIFLVPSETLGFQHDFGDDFSAVKLMRSVFIDLNKHARVVKRSRLILLDDADPHSLLVRRLLSPRLRDTTADAPLQDGRLPLTIVDWHTDQAKFDTGPYITTVLALDRIVQTLLDSEPVNDWTKHSRIQTQLNAFARFGFDKPEIEARLTELRDAEVSWQAHFSYSGDELSEIEETVGAKLASFICAILTQISPYRELIARRDVDNMLSSQFTNWYEAYSEATSGNSEAALSLLEKVKVRIRSSESPPSLSSWRGFIEEDVSELKGNSLFFKVVFQTSLFKALKKVWNKTPPVFLVDGDVATDVLVHDDPRKYWCNALVNTLNTIISAEPDFFSLKYSFAKDSSQIEFWLGSALTLDGRMDYTQSALKRMAEWVRFFCLINVALVELEKIGMVRPPKYQDLITELDQMDRGYKERLSKRREWIIRGNSANHGSMRRIAMALNPGKESDDQAVQEEAERQFRYRVGRIYALIRG